MYISFGVRFEVHEEGIDREYGGVDVGIECFIVDEHSDGAFFGADIGEEKVDIGDCRIDGCDSGFEVGSTDVSHDLL